MIKFANRYPPSHVVAVQVAPQCQFGLPLVRKTQPDRNQWNVMILEVDMALCDVLSSVE